MPIIFQKGDRLKIHRGTFRTNGRGTFLRYAGEQSAAVAVDGDDRLERTIRLTSVSFLPETPPRNRNRNRKVVVVDAAEYEQMLAEMEHLTVELSELKQRFKKWKN